MKNTESALNFIDELIGKDLSSGDIIRARRRTLNLTQQDIAKITGLKVTYLSAVENDRKAIGVATASKIAAAIGLHPSSILFPNDFSSDKEVQKIIRKREKLLKEKVA